MSSRSIAICVDPDADELERFAACELESYLEKLFGIRAGITSAPADEADTRFVLGLKGRPHVDPALRDGGTPDLSDQGHLVRRVSGDTMVLAGGSPAAVCWAVYELVERYGVRYLVHGDVLPERPGPFGLPDVDEALEPVQRTRVVRLTRDNAIGNRLLRFR